MVDVNAARPVQVQWLVAQVAAAVLFIYQHRKRLWRQPVPGETAKRRPFAVPCLLSFPHAR